MASKEDTPIKSDLKTKSTSHCLDVGDKLPVSTTNDE